MISWLDQRAEGAAQALAEIMPPSVQFKRLAGGRVRQGHRAEDILAPGYSARGVMPVLPSCWTARKLSSCISPAWRSPITPGASAYRLFAHDTRDWDGDAREAAGIDPRQATGRPRRY